MVHASRLEMLSVGLGTSWRPNPTCRVGSLCLYTRSHADSMPHACVVKNTPAGRHAQDDTFSNTHHSYALHLARQTGINADKIVLQAQPVLTVRSRGAQRAFLQPEHSPNPVV